MTARAQVQALPSRPMSAWDQIRLDRRVTVAGLLLTLLVAVAILAPALFTDPNAQSASGRLLGPSWSHPFGTDELRRDLLSRTFFGLRTSLVTSAIAVPIGAFLGITLGMVSGYAGRTLDAFVMRVIDAWLAFPGLLAAIAILTIAGPTLAAVALALVTFVVPGFTRLSRAQMLAERSKDYVTAARSIGAPPYRIIVRHITLNALPPLLTQIALVFSASIMIAAALSFLGLGERPPNPTLGGLISASRPHLRDAWWYLTFPSAVLGLILLSLTLIADGVSDALSGASRPIRRSRSQL